MKKEWRVFALKVGAWIAAAAAAHFLTTIFLGGPPDYLVPAILGLGALQIGLLDRTPLPAGEGRMLKRGIALIMIAFAAFLGMDGGAEGKIPWQPYADEKLQAAINGKRPVMINFMTQTCPYCFQMERKVFSNDRVARAAESFLTLQADLSETTSNNIALAQKFNVEMFPTIVFIGSDGQERRNLRLEGFENARFFAERVEQAR